MTRAAPLLFLALFACKGGSDPTDSDSPLVFEPQCTTPTDVPCFDEMLLDLGLHPRVADGRVDTNADGDGYITEVDATAGGFQEAANNPWVYLKFTDDGAEKVAIDDEAALESMDWDMAFHRFKIRLNSGSSGPSCVTAGVVGGKDYADVAVGDFEGTTRFEDDYYTDTCDIINDSSGLPGSPQVAMGPWWSYPGCVATTRAPFILQLANGRALKLVVNQYYGSNQSDCNNSDVPGGNAGSIRMKWAYLQ